MARRLRPLAQRLATDSAIEPPVVRQLFAHGRLADERFFAGLLERPVAGSPAELLDFELLVPEGFAEVVLLANEGARAVGRLFRHLSDEDLARLDAYRGLGEGLYFRDLGEVVRPGGAAADGEAAWIYLPTAKTVERFGRGRSSRAPERDDAP
jgi:hypothetical protein